MSGVVMMMMPLVMMMMVVVVVVRVEAQTWGNMVTPTAHNFTEMGVKCKLGREKAKKGTCRKMCGREDGTSDNPPEYTAGQEIDVTIHYTVIFQSSIYYYYFDFKLCPINDKKVLTQKCLDSTVLNVRNQTGELTDKYGISGNTVRGRTVSVTVQLPEGVTCTKCVLQWTFGFDKEKCIKNAPRSTACPDKGSQENCAIIRIN